MTSNQTVQRLSATIGQSAVLVLLPDPVTPFRDAAYSQAQSFILEPGTSTYSPHNYLPLAHMT